jgi:hypothetical protein
VRCLLRRSTSAGPIGARSTEKTSHRSGWRIDDSGEAERHILPDAIIVSADGTTAYLASRATAYGASIVTPGSTVTDTAGKPITVANAFAMAITLNTDAHRELPRPPGYGPGSPPAPPVVRGGAEARDPVPPGLAVRAWLGCA